MKAVKIKVDKQSKKRYKVAVRPTNRTNVHQKGATMSNINPRTISSRKLPSTSRQTSSVEKLNGMLAKNATLYLVQVDRDDRREEIVVLYQPAGGKIVNVTKDVAFAGVGPIGRSDGVLMHDTPAKFVREKMETRIRQRLGRNDVTVQWLEG